MLRDDVLNLDRVDVLTTRDDHVLDPVDDEHIGLGVHVPAVAGVHPSAPVLQRSRRGGSSSRPWSPAATTISPTVPRGSSRSSSSTMRTSVCRAARPAEPPVHRVVVTGHEQQGGDESVADPVRPAGMSRSRRVLGARPRSASGIGDTPSMMCSHGRDIDLGGTGESTIIWSMVGTSRTVSDAECSAIISSAPDGVKARNISASDDRSPVHEAISGEVDMGAACRSRPSGVAHSPEATQPYAEVIMLSWVSVTPFGLPVVPPCRRSRRCPRLPADGPRQRRPGEQLLIGKHPSGAGLFPHGSRAVSPE